MIEQFTFPGAKAADRSRHLGLRGDDKRAVTTLGLLSWAFATECASLSFDEFDRYGGSGCGIEYRLLQQHRLGCQVDGGGFSAPADDADIVAELVAWLPEGCGGKAMAIQVAECARSGIMPDWLPGARVRLVPRAWRKENQHGRRAATEVVDTVRLRTRRGTIEQKVEWCPITYAPSPARIAAARRGYLLWWGALLHLRTEFQSREWKRHVVTDELPPRAPWQESS